MSIEVTAYGAIDLGREQFELIASESKLVRWAEESEFAVQALNKNPMLQQCQPRSIQEAITNVASIGLSLNPHYGYAYLVPDSIKVGNSWIKVCQLRVSFKGLLKIATDSKSIKFARAEIVRANDEFFYNGPMAAPVHKMDPFGGDRGDIVGVYCIAKTYDNEYLTDIMSREEIEEIKKAAKQPHVWNKWLGEMSKKAILKRSAKTWPAGDGMERLATAVCLVNEAEGSVPIEREITPAKAEPVKLELQGISDQRFKAGLGKIKEGAFTVEKMLANYKLTEEQHKRLNDLEATLGAVYEQ